VDAITIPQAPIDLGPRIIENTGKCEVSQRAQRLVLGAAGLDGIGITVAYPKLGTGCLFQSREPSGMVEVGMGVQQEFHISRFETQGRDAVQDHRGSPGISTIDQDMAFGSGEQKRGSVVGTDVVKVAGNAEWLSGLLPPVVARRPPEAE
jgi:hypothetical protein